MPDEQKTIIEIKGIKFEVDLRTARRIDEYRIGDRVKVLKKEYSDNLNVYYGIIVGFDNFKDLPTIVVIYLKDEYSSAQLQFGYINSQSKDIEITHAEYEELPIRKADVIERFDNQILKKQAELEGLQQQKAFFITHFQKTFGDLNNGSDAGE